MYGVGVWVVGWCGVLFNSYYILLYMGYIGVVYCVGVWGGGVVWVCGGVYGCGGVWCVLCGMYVYMLYILYIILYCCVYIVFVLLVSC